MRARIATWLCCCLATIALIGCTGDGAGDGSGGPKDLKQGNGGYELRDLKVEVVRVILSEPQRVEVGEEEITTSELFEFWLTPSNVIPVRALEPRLMVGDRLVAKYRYEPSSSLVFVELQPDRLSSGSEIIFMWDHDPEEKWMHTGIRYNPDDARRVFR